MAFVIDVFARCIVGWRVSGSARSMRWSKRCTPAAPSARTGSSIIATAGCSTCRSAIPNRLAEAEIEPSVGSVGDSYDNALAETINGLYKAEVIHRHSWKSREAMELATLAWVDWFNHRRLLEPIGNIPPAEAEAAYYRQLDESVMVA